MALSVTPPRALGYTDHSRSVTLNTRDKFREWTAWAKGFSDARMGENDTSMGDHTFINN
jgi:hypothetical protein